MVAVEGDPCLGLREISRKERIFGGEYALKRIAFEMMGRRISNFCSLKQHARTKTDRKKTIPKLGGGGTIEAFLNTTHTGRRPMGSLAFFF